MIGRLAARDRGRLLAFCCGPVVLLLLLLDLLPPLISPETTPGILEQAQATLEREERSFRAAQQAAAVLAGPRGDFEQRGKDLAALAGPQRAQAQRELGADARLLETASRAAEGYREALAGYDVALMARTRGLGPGSEQLRDHTWPVVEQVRLYPPPRGENPDFLPPSTQQIAAWAAAIEQGDLPAVLDASRDLGRATYALGVYFEYDAAYRAALERYATRLREVAGAQEPIAPLRRALALLAGLGLALLLGLALALLTSPEAPSVSGGPTALGPADGSAALPGPDQLALAAGAVACYYLLPGVLSVLAGAALVWLAFVRWPATALALIPAAIPLYYRPRRIGPYSFTLMETLILLAFAALCARALLGRLPSYRMQFTGFRRQAQPARPSVRLPSPRALLREPLAWGALLLLLAALLSLLSPLLADRHIALRELRRTVLEPLLVLLLLLGAAPRLRALAPAGFIVACGFVASDALVRLLLGGGTWEMEGLPRLIGLLPSSTALGIVLGAALSGALARALTAPTRPLRQGYALLAAPLGLATGLTFTRGAWVGVAAAMLIVLVVSRRWRWLLGLGVALALAFGALGVFSPERLRSTFSLSEGSGLARREIWASAARLLGESPLLGIGLDQFSYQDVARFGIPQIRFLQISHPHNLIFDLWLQLGLLGLLAVLAVLGLALRRLLRAGTRAGGRLAPGAVSAAGWSLPAAAMLIDMSVHGLLDQALLGADMLVLFWACVALAAGGVAGRDPKDAEIFSPQEAQSAQRS